MSTIYARSPTVLTVLSERIVTPTVSLAFLIDFSTTGGRLA